MRSHYPLLVTRAGENSGEEIASARSLGMGGCHFASAGSLGEGTILELLISLDLRPVSVPAKVVWETPRAGGGFDIGVEFFNLGHDERLILEQLCNQDVQGLRSS